MLRRRSILVATLCLALSACGSLIPAGHQTTDTAKLQTSIDVASVDTPSGDLDEILRGPDWLNAERFPTARFESRSITVTSPTTGMITGDLTLHGVTAPITLEVTFRGGADNLLTGFYTLGFEAKSTSTRSTFGIGSLIPAIADTVTLEIHAEFQRIDG